MSGETESYKDFDVSKDRIEEILNVELYLGLDDWGKRCIDSDSILDAVEAIQKYVEQECSLAIKKYIMTLPMDIRRAIIKYDSDRLIKRDPSELESRLEGRSTYPK